MSNRFVFAASVAALAALVVFPAQTATAKAKTKRATAYRVGHNYFVPPPPPYSPTITPLTNVMYNGGEGEADADVVPAIQTPQTRWSKYIYVRQGYEAPHGVSSNKYITTWHKT
jgi:hypothetical protein